MEFDIKKISLVLVSLIICSFVFSACSGSVSSSSDKALLISDKTTQYFTDEALPESDIDTPLAIIVSCGNKGEFDAGLTMQNIFDYAILSGYGAKIFTSPCKMLNDGYKEKFGVPSNMSVVATINIGKKKNMDGVDGVTSASTRKPYDEVVTRIE